MLREQLKQCQLYSPSNDGCYNRICILCIAWLAWNIN